MGQLPGFELDTPEVEQYRERLKDILGFTHPEMVESKVMLLIESVWIDAKEGDSE